MSSQRQPASELLPLLAAAFPHTFFKPAAKRFFKQLLKGLRYVPRVVVTDKLRRYGAALKEVMPSVEHRQQTG